MAQQNIKSGSLKPGEVKPKEDVTIYGTGTKSPSGRVVLEAGKEYIVHRVHADTLVANGYATKDKPAAKK